MVEEVGYGEDEEDNRVLLTLARISWICDDVEYPQKLESVPNECTGCAQASVCVCAEEEALVGEEKEDEGDILFWQQLQQYLPVQVC